MPSPTPKRLSRSELFARIDACEGPQASAAGLSECEAEIWASCGRTCAILAIDLSGFTRITRERGIFHFLAMFRRASGIARGCVETHHGAILKLDADNVFATFDRVSHALSAARALVRSIDASNTGRDEGERARVCQGIGYGKILVLSDDFYGDEVNVACKVGEDVAGPDEVLLTDAAHAQIAGEGASLDAEARVIQLGGAAATCWKVRHVR